MKIAAINTSPRTNWNTASLVQAAARGAIAEGAEVEYFDLYKQEAFTGCVSCFGCKLEPNLGKCVCRDGLYPVLEAIREADAVIIGSPNYLGQPNAGYHALMERFVFPCISYKKEQRSYHTDSAPVLFIMTSNVPDNGYEEGAYAAMIAQNKRWLDACIGPAKVFIYGNTLQTDEYERYDWTMFDVEDKRAQRETVYPAKLEEAFELGRQLASGGEWA